MLFEPALLDLSYMIVGGDPLYLIIVVGGDPLYLIIGFLR